MLGKTIMFLGLGLGFNTIINSQSINLTKDLIISVSSVKEGDKNLLTYINDGVVSDVSSWISAKEDVSWITLQVEGQKRIGGLHIYSGWGEKSPIQNFKIQYWKDKAWRMVPSANISHNEEVALALTFDDNEPIFTDKLRILISKTPDNIARIKEVVIWEYSGSNLPKLGTDVKGNTHLINQEDIPLVYINQSGYNLGKPKRFTVPTVDDGTNFSIKNVRTKEIEFNGIVSNHKGDFSNFNPESFDEYVIEAGPHVSFPFRIGQWWLERVSYQGMINFMIDSRHYVGDYKGTQPGSFSWRDDTHFGWELHTLVPQYLSHPEAFKRMSKQITYDVSTDPKLWGQLKPYDESAPDIVKLMHWGADVIITQGLTHENVKAQLAYFLYAWPWIKEWLPQQNYDVVKDFVLEHWEQEKADRNYPYNRSPEHNLLTLKTKMGTTKGELPPGRTVQPNLLLFEVAKRDGYPNPEKYFKAAYNQVKWIIEALNWEDPITTKGQRMSEFLTITGLAHMYTQYPKQAPSGLKEKVEQWAEVVISRSNNMWDFRKYTDNAEWVPYDETAATKWNEPGNVMGFPACIFAAQQVLDKPSVENRLTEIAFSHFENCFGRNPCGRHYSYDAPREIEGVDVGWYSYYKGGIGMLENTRFVFDGGPKYQHYPYHPEVGNVGWTEGWVQFNVAYNISLAYLANQDIEFTSKKVKKGYKITLKVPQNFDYEKVEQISVDIKWSNGKTGVVQLTEDSENSAYFSTIIPKKNKIKEVSYGYGYFKKTIDN